MFRRIWARPMLLAALGSTVIPCVPAAIEETIALAAQVQEEALVVEAAVAGDDDKNGLGGENNEHQVGLHQFLKNFSDRFHNRRFWICKIAVASGLRKEIRYR